MISLPYRYCDIELNQICRKQLTMLSPLLPLDVPQPVPEAAVVVAPASEPDVPALELSIEVLVRDYVVVAVNSISLIIVKLA